MRRSTVFSLPIHWEVGGLAFKILKEQTLKLTLQTMEQRTLKNVNNYLITNIYTYLEKSSGQSSNLYLDVVHFFNTSVN